MAKKQKFQLNEDEFIRANTEEQTKEAPIEEKKPMPEPVVVEKTVVEEKKEEIKEEVKPMPAPTAEAAPGNPESNEKVDLEAIIASQLKKLMAENGNAATPETRGRKKNPNAEKKIKRSVDLSESVYEGLIELCRKYQKENGITKNVGISTYINMLCEKEVERNKAYLDAHK